MISKSRIHLFAIALLMTAAHGCVESTQPQVDPNSQSLESPIGVDPPADNTSKDTQQTDRDAAYVSTFPVTGAVSNTLPEDQRKTFEFFTMLVPANAVATGYEVSLNGQCKLTVVVNPEPAGDLSAVVEKVSTAVKKLDANAKQERARVAGREGIVFSLSRTDSATGKKKVQKTFLTTCNHLPSLKGMYVVQVNAVMNDDVASEYSGIVDEMVQSIKVTLGAE